MKKYYVYGKVVGTAYLGEVSAKSQADAEKKADSKFSQASISLCHQCADGVGNLGISDFIVEAEYEEGE